MGREDRTELDPKEPEALIFAFLGRKGTLRPQSAFGLKNRPPFSHGGRGPACQTGEQPAWRSAWAVWRTDTVAPDPALIPGNPGTPLPGYVTGKIIAIKISLNNAAARTPATMI